jgi:hypothetical protein
VKSGFRFLSKRASNRNTSGDIAVIAHSREASLRGGWNYFVGIIFGYFLYLLLMQSDWIISGAMWAEMATNYYPIAMEKRVYLRLFATDAGYIPLPQRLIAYSSFALNLPYKVIPYFYTVVSIFATGALVAVFALNIFRVLIRVDTRLSRYCNKGRLDSNLGVHCTYIFYV